MDISSVLDLLQTVDTAELAKVIGGTFLVCGGIFRVTPDYGDGYKWTVSTMVGSVLGWVFITLAPAESLLFGGIAGILTTYGVAVFKGKQSS